MTDAPPTIAATSTLAMVRTAEARGIAVQDLLREADLSLGFLEDPDARIPAATVLALWNRLRERTGDPALQLVAPTTLPFGAYRVIDYLCAASATVGESVQRFARYFGLIAEAISLEVEAGEGGASLVLSRADGSPVPPVYVDYVFAAFVSRVRMRIRRDLRVRRVDLRQAEPAWGARHAEVFGAEIRFGAAADRLSLDREVWLAATETGDAALAQLLEEHAEILARRVPRADAGFRVAVEKAIASAPPEGGSVEDVARALNVSVRTLQRKLIEGGTSFRKVSEAVRGQLAEAYLKDPRVGIAEVAFLLGFSDQSSFNRAFRRWTGVSPGKWRRRA